MKKQCIKLYAKYKSLVNNEQGAQTLEWVAIGAVVVTIAALLGQAFEGNGIKGVVDQIMNKITESL
jgi:hypothetical protein